MVKINEIKFSESETLELKTSTSELKEAIISITAILNKHQKGELYFGIKDSGEIMGQEVSDKTLRGVSQKISEGIEPKIFPRIKKVEIEEKKCILVIFKGYEIPYYAFGKAYIRVSDQNKQMSAKEIENFILKKNKEKIRWDNLLSERTINDINIELLKKYIERGKESGRISFDFSDVKTTLKKLNLMKEDSLLRAAEVLFCDENNLEIQVAVFAGIDKTTFIDIKELKGNIFFLLEQSESYIKQHINWRADLSKRTREEIPEIPIRAIIETLVNSLAHRDYFAYESNKIAIFKDRIEIWNPGNFPEGFTPLDYIRKEEPSILRNPLIAEILFKSKNIEKWGSGIRRIYNECKDNNVKVKFLKRKYGFSVVFYRNGKEITAQKTTLKTTQKELSLIQKKIIEEIEKDNKITRELLAKRIGNISEDGVKYNLKNLVNFSILKRIGGRKHGYWKISKRFFRNYP